MKLIIVILIALFGLLQYQLWFADGGLLSAVKMHTDIRNQSQLSQKLTKRNQILVADIEDLKHGKQAVEAHARYDLGMVKKGEVFYQVVTTKH